MKVRVIVQRFEGELVEGAAGEEVYSQTVDAEAFDFAALIRAVNTRKRVRAPRGKKETA